MNEDWTVSLRSDGQVTQWTHEDGSRIRREERRGRGRYGLGAGTWYVLTNEREEYAARTLEGAQQRHRDYAQQSSARVWDGHRWITDAESDKRRESMSRMLNSFAASGMTVYAA